MIWKHTTHLAYEAHHWVTEHLLRWAFHSCQNILLHCYQYGLELHLFKMYSSHNPKNSIYSFIVLVLFFILLSLQLKHISCFSGLLSQDSLKATANWSISQVQSYMENFWSWCHANVFTLVKWSCNEMWIFNKLFLSMLVVVFFVVVNFCFVDIFTMLLKGYYFWKAGLEL